MSLLAKNLKYLREYKQLKQNEMLDAIGFKPSTWNNYERGVAEPKILDLIKICNYFEVSLDELINNNILSDAQLIKKEEYKKTTSNAQVNAQPHAQINQKNHPKNTKFSVVEEPCDNCIYKDEIIKTKNGQIEALKSALNHAEQRLHEKEPLKKQAG